MKIRTKATSTSRTVNYKSFLEGVMADQSRLSLTPTTVIPDVLDHMIHSCYSIDPDSDINMLKPNGYTSASLSIAIKGEGFEVVCERILVRGLLPINPFAAEFGSNYDVFFTIRANDSISELLKKRIAKYVY